MTDATKLCSTCRIEQPKEAFSKRARAHDGLQSRCRACFKVSNDARRLSNPDYGRVKMAEWVKRNPKRFLAAKRKYKYGITGEEFDAMVTAQDGKCAICRTEVETLCVDHCHTTGRIRGLLCSPCNLGIGHLRDDPSILTSAASYLTA